MAVANKPIKQVDARMMTANPDYIPNPQAADGSITLPAATADVFGIPDPAVLPGFHHGLVHVHARHAERAEEIALAAFVHADPRQQQVGIQHRFVADPRLLENFQIGRAHV